jgi:ubiquinone/menaquinone biosynthesis C-methylase UbiE/ribosomal protein S18 acetylase RimI-like enzyme
MTLQFRTAQDWHSWFVHQATWTQATRQWLYAQVDLPAARTALEVGCGTGVIAGEIARLGPAVTGLDRDAGMLAVARREAPAVQLVQGDAHALPFPDGAFDLVLCHYLLLWLADPVQGVQEMARVVRPGGVVLACAEPDYGGRVDYPPEMARLGQLQAESLRRQGADPSIGRRLGELFAAAGLDATVGVMAGQVEARHFPEPPQAEWAMRRHDLEGLVTTEELDRLEELDRAAAAAGRRVLFVPTFYAWGSKGGTEVPAANLSSMNLRPVRPEERAAFTWMVLQTLRDGDLSVAAVMRSPFLTRWMWRVLHLHYHRRSRPLILEVDGMTAGFLVLRQVKQTLVIEALGVLAAFRQQGWGMVLLEQAAQEARRLGLARLELHVSSGNRPALALYARAGFYPVPRTWSGIQLERILSPRAEE